MYHEDWKIFNCPRQLLIYYIKCLAIFTQGLNSFTKQSTFQIFPYKKLGINLAQFRSTQLFCHHFEARGPIDLQFLGRLAVCLLNKPLANRQGLYLVTSNSAGRAKNFQFSRYIYCKLSGCCAHSTFMSIAHAIMSDSQRCAPLALQVFVKVLGCLWPWAWP